MAIYHVKFIGQGSRSVYSTGISGNAIKVADRLHKQTGWHLEVVKLEQVYKTYGNDPVEAEGPTEATRDPDFN